MAQENKKSVPLIVAAIDFGTTYSGFAFSFRSDFEKDPLNVHTKEWRGGHFLSSKCPTTALLEKKDGNIVLKSFGFAAESEYPMLVLEDKHENLLFFRRFKMMLFEAKQIKRDILLSDIAGKQLPAMQVFKLSIKYLKDEMMALLESRIKGVFLKEEIRWVITVPAIWNNVAKEFMREAAAEAGIPNDQLIIALEPEAGSLYCRHLDLEKVDDSSESKLQTISPGTKYVLLDAGGGTIDVAVHEVLTVES